MGVISTSSQAFALVHRICISSHTSFDEQILLGHLDVQLRIGLRIKDQILQRGLCGDGVVCVGEEREPHGLVSLEVDLGGLEAREPAQQVLQLPLLNVDGEARDEDGADLVRAGAGGGVWCTGNRGRRRDGGRC